MIWFNLILILTFESIISIDINSNRIQNVTEYSTTNTINNTGKSFDLIDKNSFTNIKDNSSCLTNTTKQEISLKVENFTSNVKIDGKTSKENNEKENLEIMKEVFVVNGKKKLEFTTNSTTFIKRSMDIEQFETIDSDEIQENDFTTIRGNQIIKNNENDILNKLISPVLGALNPLNNVTNKENEMKEKLNERYDNDTSVDNIHSNKSNSKRSRDNSTNKIKENSTLKVQKKKFFNRKGTSIENNQNNIEDFLKQLFESNDTVITDSKNRTNKFNIFQEMLNKNKLTTMKKKLTQIEYKKNKYLKKENDNDISEAVNIDHFQKNSINNKKHNNVRGKNENDFTNTEETVVPNNNAIIDLLNTTNNIENSSFNNLDKNLSNIKDDHDEYPKHKIDQTTVVENDTTTTIVETKTTNNLLNTSSIFKTHLTTDIPQVRRNINLTVQNFENIRNKNTLNISKQFFDLGEDATLDDYYEEIDFSNQNYTNTSDAILRKVRNKDNNYLVMEETREVLFADVNDYNPSGLELNGHKHVIQTCNNDYYDWQFNANMGVGRIDGKLESATLTEISCWDCDERKGEKCLLVRCDYSLLYNACFAPRGFVCRKYEVESKSKMYRKSSCAYALSAYYDPCENVISTEESPGVKVQNCELCWDDGCNFYYQPFPIWTFLAALLFLAALSFLICYIVRVFRSGRNLCDQNSQCHSIYCDTSCL